MTVTAAELAVKMAWTAGQQHTSSATQDTTISELSQKCNEFRKAVIRLIRVYCRTVLKTKKENL